MQRDLDLIRKILFEVEKKETPSDWITIQLADYSNEKIAYHVKMLAEENYLEARDLTTKQGFDWRPVSLTWKGHEFLEVARDNTIWNKAKKHLGNKLASVSLEVLKTLLVGIGNQTLGL